MELDFEIEARNAQTTAQAKRKEKKQHALVLTLTPKATSACGLKLLLYAALLVYEALN